MGELIIPGTAATVLLGGGELLLIEKDKVIEVMHSDPDWKIDPEHPLIWAPPCPPEKIEEARHLLTQNFKRTRDHDDYVPLTGVTQFDFMRGPTHFYEENIFAEDGETVIDTIVHTDTWIYPFAWYVNTGEFEYPSKHSFTMGGPSREIIEVPL